MAELVLTGRCEHCGDQMKYLPVRSEPEECPSCRQVHLIVTFEGWCPRCERLFEVAHKL